MDTPHSEFTSIRRALKVCSFALLLIATVHAPVILVSIGHSASLFHDLMGNTPQPAVFAIAEGLSRNFLLCVLAALIILGTALTVTIKAKGGAFLYVNIGLFLMVWIVSLYLLMAAQELARLPLEKLTQ